MTEDTLCKVREAPDPRLALNGETPWRLHHYFERQVDARPDACALVCGAERLSYAELDARANQLAHYLARQAIGPGDRVGLLVERSVHAYVALLAALKCGAAYVPIDPAAPADRIAFIAGDADLDLLLTTSKFHEVDVPCRVLALDTDPRIAGHAASGEIAQMPDTRLEDPEGDAPCYVIYTSGTTGRPKGVTITHFSICNLLEVSLPIYGVTAHDRVYQGMTFSFDFSIEELWHTFATGATLVAGPTDARKLGEGLARFLTEHEVTVLCCVPTLLATLPTDVPTLRTLIVGGEVCPAELVKRWCRPGLRMLNTYGPTETTVTATWREVFPDQPVTIGKPFLTYTTYILDEDLRPVPDGEVGEICIGGPGVGVGYVNRPELTRDRFIPDPFCDEPPDARLYRTGDLGRQLPDGELEFLGRMDTQIKVRGYRAEPAEVEAVLLESPEVENAAVVPLTEGGVVVDLAAYITLRGTAGNRDEVQQRLHELMQARLPSYMVPAYLELVATFPQLPSGKVDRARLPAPCSPRLGTREVVATAPATPLEHHLAEVWDEVLGRDEVSVLADFFYDLGGHSLAAAQVISRLRHEPGLGHLGVGDLYAHPTIRALARHIEATARPAEGDAATARPVERLQHNSGRILACGAGQFALGYLLAVLAAVPFCLIFAARAQYTLIGLVIAGVITAAIFFPLSFILPIALKWLLIGRFRPGRYPLWGWYYCRWWLARKAMGAAPTPILAGSPLLPVYARMLGARIGKGVHLGSPHLHLPDLIDIGDDASIGYGVELRPFTVEDGWLHVAPVRVGSGAFIGTNAVVMLGGSVGDDARVLEQSLVARDQAIPATETWAGSPSERVAQPDLQLDEMARQPAPGPWSAGLIAGFLAGYLLLVLLPVLLAGPGLVFLYLAYSGSLVRCLLATPVVAVLSLLTVCLGIALAKKLVLPSVRPGLYPLRSSFGVRKWLSDKLMSMGLGITHTVFGTLYVRPWLRLLGVQMGPRAEVSTVAHIDPDLLRLGAECFTADQAVIGAVRYHNGMIALGTTEVGTRTFVGNSALLPCGTKLPDGSLIGVLSVAPSTPIEPGSSYLGSPAIFLPRRQESAKFDEAVTFRPPARLYAMRLAIEFFRVTLPATIALAFLLLGAVTFLSLAERLPTPLLIAILPAVGLAFALATTGIVVGLKWLIVGRYRPRVEPLWSHFVWRTELITGLYETVVAPGLFAAFTGTPWLPPLMRLLGARIGKRVWMDTSYLTEFDLVEVGDDAQVGGATSLQTHLFEDRVMKMSTVTVGRHASVGARTVVLYDAVLEDGSRLDALSLAMKGEALPAETKWRGIPARVAD